jgi:hypothetical protein
MGDYVSSMTLRLFHEAIILFLAVSRVAGVNKNEGDPKR